jgi:hypothetical protein
LSPPLRPDRHLQPFKARGKTEQEIAARAGDFAFIAVKQSDIRAREKPSSTQSLTKAPTNSNIDDGDLGRSRFGFVLGRLD